MPAGEYRARDRDIHPPPLTPDYKTTVTRSPRQPLLSLQQSLSELTGPVFGHGDLDPLDNDLIRNAQVDGEPVGERIHRPRPRARRERPAGAERAGRDLAGQRRRQVPPRQRPLSSRALDPNFRGCGRTLTDADGGYRFRTIKPGPYPWRNRLNDWRPAHIHFSMFGTAFVTRLITQIYFEGDPLLRARPDLTSIPDAGARERLVAPLDLDGGIPLDTLAYRFDIVLRGRRQTPSRTGRRAPEPC